MGLLALILAVVFYFVQQSALKKLRSQFDQQLQQLRAQIASLQQQLQVLNGERSPSSSDPLSDAINKSGDAINKPGDTFIKPSDTLAQRIGSMTPPSNAETVAEEVSGAEQPAIDPWRAPDASQTPIQPIIAAATAPQTTAATKQQNIVDEKSPSITSSIGASIIAWFKGGNTIVRLAVVIIFIGVAFLLRYAAEHAVFPIEVRLAAVALGALALAGFGWKVRNTRHAYGVSLQGAGIGVLYLTVFAALRLYQLIPASLAFPLLIALAIVTALLALLQDALALAVFGFSGAFLAPVLASTGEGSHVALFSYFLIINIAIAWIAQQRAWKLLNLVGFFFTFTIGIAWGLRSWQPEFLLSTEPFLIAHLLLYLWISINYSRQLALLEQPKLPYVDGTLVFGTPIIAFGLQAGMVKHIPFGLALSAAAMAAIYLWLGLRLWRQMGEKMRLLSEGMLALGVVFLILIAPLALDARWTSAAWALQGAGVAWLAIRQRRAWALAMGIALQFGAAVAFYGHPWVTENLILFFNAMYFGVVILTLCALFTARQLEFAARAVLPTTSSWSSTTLRAAHWLMLLSGLLWLLAGTWREIYAADWRIDDMHRLVGLLACVALLLELVYRRLDWPQLAIPARPLLGVALLVALLAMASHLLFFGDSWAYIGFDAVIEFIGLVTLCWWLLRRLDLPSSKYLSSHAAARGTYAIEHVVAAWFVLLQSGLLAYALAGHYIIRHEVWTMVALIVPATVFAMFVLKRLRNSQWPAAQHPLAWLQAVNVAWLMLLTIWMLIANLVSDGSMAPLPYLPLLNPIDLAHVLIALFAMALFGSYRAVAADRQLNNKTRIIAPSWLRGVLVLAAFWWLNSVLIRTLHQWSGTPLWLDGALETDLVQTSLSILWTLTALSTMFVATRRATVANKIIDVTAGAIRWRAVWMLGATLLGLVVIKLLLVDMSNSGTLARIVSFLGVGVLMLVIGYLSPMPPARKNTAGEVAC